MPRRFRRCFLIISGLAGLFLLGMLALVADGLHDDLGKTDVALVLGNKVELDGTPSKRLQARLDRTLELYRAGYFPFIITSGGVGKEGFDEAVVMKNHLVARGVPAERVIVDSEGVTTFASAKNTMKVAREHGFSSVFLISQYFHVSRSCMVLHRMGMATLHSAHARIFELRDLYSVPRELIAYISYRFRDDPEAMSKDGE